MKQQVKDHIRDRIAFLDGVQADLAALEALAREAGNQTLITELATVSRQAKREAALLRGESVPGGPDNGQAGAPTLLRAGDLGDARAITQRPAAAMARVTPAIPKMPVRTREDIYRDVEALTQRSELVSPIYEGIPGLLRLKGLLCLQRALQAELAAQDIQHWSLRQLLNYLRRRVDEEHGPGHYLIALRAELWPTEPWPWQRLAHLYEGLAQAYDALSWFCAEASRLTIHERQDLLESIGAHQTRVYRHLQAYFPRQNDEHQINLFRDLCALAEQEDVYLFTLQERCPDEMLEERAELLGSLLEQLQADGDTRARREQVLEALRAIVGEPDFGTRDEDAAILADLVTRCQAAGIPPSSTALRAALLDWASLLEENEDPAVQDVVRELQREVERQAHRRTDTDLSEPEHPLSDDETAELEAVREVVRGKRCLFIGGTCREEARLRLEQELELAELIWPSTTGTESVYRFEPDIESSDITVILVRFVRTGWSQARDLAAKHNKQFVRLPAGYGLLQVVRQFHRQLLPDQAVVTAP